MMDICPKCGGTEIISGYGFAAGGLGGYEICLDCDTFLTKFPEKEMEAPLTVLLFSGGMDSATLLFRYLQLGHRVLPVMFNYGQRHEVELMHGLNFLRRAHRLWCDRERIALDQPQAQRFFPRLMREVVVVFPQFAKLVPTSSQTNKNINVPNGHYQEPSMKITVVPNRNMVMLAIAASIAIAREAKTLAFACHAGDHAIYPDCTPAFFQAMQKSFHEADWRKLVLDAPYINFTKASIVLDGHELGVPYEDTWSCYNGDTAANVATGRSTHCGKCGTCSERREAFELAHVPDPTHYAK